MSRSNGKSPSGENPEGGPPEPEQPGEASGPAPKKRKRKSKKSAAPAPVPAETLQPSTETHGQTGWSWWLVPMPMMAGAGLLAGLLWLGWEGIGQRAQPIPLDRIQITLPSHLDRGKFLDEVRYLGHLPNSLRPNVEEDLFRLRAALEKHPWIRSVNSLSARGDGLEIEVTVRKPVLIVGVAPATSPGGKPRMVDEAGVLLPVGEAQPLPILEVAAPPPAGEPGQLWGDPTVEKAAAMAAWIGRQDPPMALTAIRGGPGNWALLLDQRWVLWREGIESANPTKMARKWQLARQRISGVPQGGVIELGDPGPGQ